MLLHEVTQIIPQLFFICLSSTLPLSYTNEHAFFNSNNKTHSTWMEMNLPPSLIFIKEKNRITLKNAWLYYLAVQFYPSA